MKQVGEYKKTKNLRYDVMKGEYLKEVSNVRGFIADAKDVPGKDADDLDGKRFISETCNSGNIIESFSAGAKSGTQSGSTGATGSSRGMK